MTDQTAERKLVEVVFTQPPYGPYTYRIPSGVPDELEGRRVRVPFGKSSRLGVVIGAASESPGDGVKDISSVVDEMPALSADLLNLTRRLAKYYLCSVGEAVAAALPTGLKPRNRVAYRLSTAAKAEPWIAEETGPSPDLWRALNRSPLTVAQIRLRFPQGQQLFDQFRGRGWLEPVEVTPKQVRERREIIYRWISDVSPSAAAISLPKKAQKQVRLASLFGDGRTMLSAKSLAEEGGGFSAALLALIGKGWLKSELVEPEESEARSGGLMETAEGDPVLSEAQSAVAERIRLSIKSDKFHTILLHGVTGSGKSLVYLEAIQTALDCGKSVIVLAPEIALTPQLAGRLRRRFGGDVVISHSGRTPAERRDVWAKAAGGKARVVLGARSAIFAPLRDLGLIILDEEHDDSYKQDSPDPRYHTRVAAQFRAAAARATLLLGSATPDVGTYHNAKSGRIELLRLPERHQGAPMPSVWVVKWGGGAEGSLFSPQLRLRIEQRLKAGEQTILLLNRRAFSTIIRCPDCREVASCPNCDVSLRYHRVGLKLECHLCGYLQRVMDTCPKCRGARLRFGGVGTQKVERELELLYPDARIARMDLDTSRKAGSLQGILSSLANRECDILLGTQMVAKGHDFPGVTLVGILSADGELFQPDFRAQERTFRLLVQASGRSGRTGAGEVVIQCFDPTASLFRRVQAADYDGFFNVEIEARRTLKYPPFSRLIAVTLKSAGRESAVSAANLVRERLLENIPPEILLGPATPEVERIEGMYRRRLMIKLPVTNDSNTKEKKFAIKETMRSLSDRFKKNGVSFIIDVDPIDV